jgi:hypothetical protein
MMEQCLIWILAFVSSISGLPAGFFIAKLCAVEKSEVYSFVSFFSQLLFASFFSVLAYFIFSSILLEIALCAFAIIVAVFIPYSAKSFKASILACILALGAFLIWGNRAAFFILCALAFIFFLLCSSALYFASAGKPEKKRPY